MEVETQGRSVLAQSEKFLVDDQKLFPWVRRVLGGSVPFSRVSMQRVVWTMNFEQTKSIYESLLLHIMVLCLLCGDSFCLMELMSKRFSLMVVSRSYRVLNVSKDMYWPNLIIGVRQF